MEGVVIRTLVPKDGIQFEIVVGAAEPDFISQQIRQQTFTFPPAFLLSFAWLRPGNRVLDLGAHIGTFSLAASALGCQVLAVEASPYNASLLRSSSARNGFEHMEVVSAAVSDRCGRLEFVEGGPFGYVANPVMQAPRIEVRAVTVDGLLEEVGWERVDFIKMDVEGSEPAAIRGMSRLLAGDDAPYIVYESNGHALSFFGETPDRVMTALQEFGYGNYLVEPGRLVSLGADHVQAACTADHLAAKRPFTAPKEWRFEGPMKKEEIVSRIVAACAHPNEVHRAYTARALAMASKKTLADRRVKHALYSLKKDPDSEVRSAMSWWPEAGSAVEGPSKSRATGHVKPADAPDQARRETEERIASVHAPMGGQERDEPADATDGDLADDDLTTRLPIEGDDIDAEAIMQEIRTRIRARRAEAKARGLDWEAYADGLYPLPPDAIMSRDLYEAVRYVGLGYDKVAVEMALTESRLPLVGGLVQRLRVALHELVLFYVNRLAARQIRFNEQTARALAALVRDLEAEVRELGARIAELEAERE
jgi:FkbM family methyltransferase